MSTWERGEKIRVYMRELAAYIMRGRIQAIWVALLFMFIPFLGWVADVIMAFVTLRKGIKEGAFVLLWIALPSVILGFMGYPQFWLYDLLGISVVTFLLAATLRYYSSWAMVLQVAMLLGIAAVFIAHLFIPNLEEIWAKEFATYLQTLKQQTTFSFDLQSMQKNGQVLLKLATGLQVGFLLIADIVNLVFARWLQSLLYNPGGIQQELKSVRLEVVATAIFGFVAVLSFFGWAPAIDSVPVIMLMFMLAGLSLVHGMLVATKKTKVWLVVFYILLVLLFPYMVILLVIAALLDSWLNFRQRFQIKT